MKARYVPTVPPGEYIVLREWRGPKLVDLYFAVFGKTIAKNPYVVTIREGLR